MADITGILGKASVNILAFNASSAGAMGYIQFVVDNAKKAKKVLRSNGISCYEEQVLHGRFTRPGAQDTRGFTGLRIAAGQSPENVSPRVTRRAAVARGEKHFDTIAGADVEDFRGAQEITQRREARRDFCLGESETSDLVNAHMAIGKTHDTDLVHGGRKTWAWAACVTEWSWDTPRGHPEAVSGWFLT